MIAEGSIDKLIAWLAEMGLNGAAEETLVHGFCERAADAGVPISRALMLIDTLHPVYEGRLMRWGHDPSLPAVVEYGRTVLPEGAADTMSEAKREEAARRWRESPFFHMLESGESLLRLTAESAEKFPIMNDHIAAGMKAALPSSTASLPGRHRGYGLRLFNLDRPPARKASTKRISTLLRAPSPTLALAVKAATLTRMTATLMETYLGRDAARRVLSGRIMRGVGRDRIDAVIWFSDLRGFTARHRYAATGAGYSAARRLCRSYCTGDPHTGRRRTQADRRRHPCDFHRRGSRARLCRSARCRDRGTKEVIVLNARRGGEGLPVTDMYLGLHVGEVFYGNIGSTERLDFTVVGPAVNEASRIAAMCRSVEQPVLVSEAFANVDGMRDRLVSVGRYALRGDRKAARAYALEPTDAE